MRETVCHDCGMEHTYPIPATRLPFVNSEIAQVVIKGEPMLVSAVWAGSAGGKIYFWNPVTRRQFMRPLPDGLPGAYMLKTAADGRLYLGCGTGELVRYDPSADSFAVLVRGAMYGITWGGCVTDRHVVWSANPGHVAVYDLREERLARTFTPIDPHTPTALYGHSVTPAPDGRIVLGMHVPQARLVLLDPRTLQADVHTPEYLQGVQWMHQVVFLDDRTLGLMIDTREAHLALVEYPSLRLIGRVPLPEAILTNQRSVVIDGAFYALMGEKRSLWRFDLPARRWHCVRRDWLSEEAAYLGHWGSSGVCALESSGMAHHLDLRTGAETEMEIDAWGPLDAHTLCVCPEANLIVGAPFINSRFWTIDLATGRGQDRGRAQCGSGQINQVVWDAKRRRALLSSYTHAALCEYDPSAGGAWPDNPKPIAEAKSHGQMRPKALAFDGTYAWMATSPRYGTLGGALVRFHAPDGEMRVWRHVVPDQTINGLVLDTPNRRVYCSSEIYADCESCPPTQTTAQVIAFSMDTLEVLTRISLPDGTPAAMVHCLLPDGRVLLEGGGTLYAWGAQKTDLRRIGPAPAALRQVQYDASGRLWAISVGKIGRLDLSEPVRFTPLIEHAQPLRHMQIVADELYYAAGTTIRRVALSAVEAR